MIVGVSGDQWRFTGKCRFLIEGLQSLEKKVLADTEFWNSEWECIARSNIWPLSL